MAITLELAPDLARVFGKREVSIEANSPRQIAQRLAAAYPRLRNYFLDSAGDPRPSLFFYVDDALLGDDEAIPDGAIVGMIFQISGG
jgi:molybdopterin converting factor small subunit